MSPGALGEHPPEPLRSAETERFEDEHGVAHRALVALSKIGLALRGQAWKETAPRGLNPTQAQILVVLARDGTDGLRLSDLAERLGVTAATVSDSISALERKGLVRKEPATDDRRALAIRLTDDGLAEARGIAEWPDLFLEAVGVLDDDEAGVLLRALLKVIRELQQRGRISPPRMCVTCTYFRPHAHDDPDRPHHCAFVDAAFGDRNLRVECLDYAEAAAQVAEASWLALAGGHSG